MIEVSNNKRYAINIILVCNAVLLSYIEMLVPIPIPVPGTKIGFANIIIIIAIAFLNYKDVVFIMIFKCLVSAFLSKGIIVLAFSLTAGFFSATVMWFLYKKAKNIFSVKGISIAGAIVHNTAQIAVASIILKENIMFYYLPILLFVAVISGFIVGIIGESAIKEIQKRDIF